MGKILSGFWKGIKILLVILGIIALLIIIAGVLAYNFLTLKEIKVCVTNEVNDTRVPCTTDSQCRQYVADVGEEFITSMDKMPPQLKEKISDLLGEASSCEQTCKIKEIRGLGEGELGNIKECNTGEKEVSYKLKAKDLVQLSRFAKGQK